MQIKAFFKYKPPVTYSLARERKKLTTYLNSALNLLP